MTLGEFTRVFSNDTSVIIKLLSSGPVQSNKVIYKGKLYQYSTKLDEEWPDNNFKNFDVTVAGITESCLDIIIEE